MAQPATGFPHPHISARPGFCGGSPVTAGTKFPVRSVVNYVLRQGLSPEEVVREFAHLSLAQIYDALSCYYDHQDQIDRELREDSEAALRPSHPEK